MFEYRSWGMKPVRASDQQQLQWQDQVGSQLSGGAKVLPFGQGRSYGDVCLNDDGKVVGTRWLDHMLKFDLENGSIECESGLTIENILQLIAPKGWFLPVVPGTAQISVGGAIANDIHGKNHHAEGTFGDHVQWLDLQRSTGEVLRCSPTENTELFNATIGGIGLTGMVLRARISLKKISTEFFKVETIKMKNLADFLRIDSESRAQFPYTVAWIDTFAGGKSTGRGLYYRAEHASYDPTGYLNGSGGFSVGVPGFWHWRVVFTPVIRLLTFLKFHLEPMRGLQKIVHFRKFLFPLDSIRNWNRLYGDQGFIQFQCVIPADGATENLDKIFAFVRHFASGSNLCVLKSFGLPSGRGMMSFPQQGYTLAMDFPNNSQTKKLVQQLNGLVHGWGGRVYLAKDAALRPDQFLKSYPQAEAFSHLIDPQFSSNLWRRLWTRS